MNSFKIEKEFMHGGAAKKVLKIFKSEFPLSVFKSLLFFLFNIRNKLNDANSKAFIAQNYFH